MDSSQQVPSHEEDVERLLERLSQRTKLDDDLDQLRAMYEARGTTLDDWLETLDEIYADQR